MELLSVRALRYSIWIGLGGMFLLFGSGLVLSGLIPPPSPEDSTDEVVRMYVEDKDRIRVGCFMMITGFTFLAMWAGALTALMRRMESKSPVFTYVQLICISVVTVIVVFIPMAWAVASFRPGDIDPDVTKTLNDIGFFLFLYPWPPLMIWLGMCGAAILSDRAAEPMFPRWAGYLCFWTALLSVPGGLISFFKDGPFAWDGVFAYWMPLGVFFVWIVGMTSCMLKVVAREEAVLTQGAQGAAGQPTAPVS